MLSYKIRKETSSYIYSALTAENMQLTFSDCYSVLLLCAGEGLTEDAHRITPGDILFVLPNSAASVTFEENCSYLLFEFKPPLIHDAHFPLHLLPDSDCFISSPLASKYALTGIFSQIHLYAFSKREGAGYMVMLYASELLAKIGEIQKYENDDADPQQKKNIKALTDYINENFCSSITLDAIAEHLYMDKSYICRLFKKEMGMTINTYINMRRIYTAMNMISAGIPPRRVCVSCGFNDYSTFYRTFKKYACMTPEEFKRSSTL